MNKPKTITLDDIEYIRVTDIKAESQKVDGMQWVIVRTYSAGVHAGYLKSRNGKEVVLIQAIRIWYWEGACSLSQLAADGTTLPDKCKFSVPVAEIILTEAIEVISTTSTSYNSISGTKSWKK